MRLGIFGGTFNPVHYGHLINAEIIRDDHSLDKILFVPSKYPVHKGLDCMTSAEDRVNMVKIAIEKNKSFDYSLVEIETESPSYTITTVKTIRMRNPEWELFLIIGADSYNEIDTWKDYKELLESVSLIVMKRGSAEQYGSGITGLPGNVIFADNPLIEISSTYIRNRIRKNLSINYLVPEKVIDYINGKRLYRN